MLRTRNQPEEVEVEIDPERYRVGDEVHRVDRGDWIILLPLALIATVLIGVIKPYVPYHEIIDTPIQVLVFVALGGYYGKWLLLSRPVGVVPSTAIRIAAPPAAFLLILRVALLGLGGLDTTQLLVPLFINATWEVVALYVGLSRWGKGEHPDDLPPTFETSTLDVRHGRRREIRDAAISMIRSQSQKEE